MNNDTLYSPKAIETEPLQRTVMVHGAMHYKCQACGRVYRMWLETGLEETCTDAKNHKPVPFTIGCLCGGLMDHIAWHHDISLPHPMPLGEHMDYFENLEEKSCGVSHLRTDGNAHTLTGTREIPKIIFPTVEEERPREIPDPRKMKCTCLESYSTTQLKDELRRRKRW